MKTDKKSRIECKTSVDECLLCAKPTRWSGFWWH